MTMDAGFKASTTSNEDKMKDVGEKITEAMEKVGYETAACQIG